MQLEWVLMVTMRMANLFGINSQTSKLEKLRYNEENEDALKS
jgi:hypothetical protein